MIGVGGGVVVVVGDVLVGVDGYCFFWGVDVYVVVVGVYVDVVGNYGCFVGFGVYCDFVVDWNVVGIDVYIVDVDIGSIDWNDGVVFVLNGCWGMYLSVWFDDVVFVFVDVGMIWGLDVIVDFGVVVFDVVVFRGRDCYGCIFDYVVFDGDVGVVWNVKCCVVRD